jgi:hypothetical protein
MTLPLEQWDTALAAITGEVYRGTERVSSEACMDALGVAADKQARAQMGKRKVRDLETRLTALEAKMHPSSDEEEERAIAEKAAEKAALE